MGYRSEVKCIIYGRPEHLDAFITKHKLKGNKFLELCAESITYGLTDRTYWKANGEREIVKQKVLDFDAHDVKWYDEFEDVAGLQNMMDDIDENWLDKVDFEYIRIGEDTKDVATACSKDSYGFIYPQTTIVVDMNLEDIPNEKD